jgi:hypothetical protein
MAIRWIVCIRRRADRVDRTPDTSALQRCGEATDQARDDANDIPQQRAVGRMMNAGLHHRGIDTQLLAVFQSELNCRPHHQSDRRSVPGVS